MLLPMTVLETNQHSEIFIARESLTKPDDVLEQMLLEEVGEDNPFMKLPAHELRLGFLPAMSDITGKGDKKVQKEINELPDTDPVKSWA